MDWNSPLGVLRRAMQIERDGYEFYTKAAERAVGDKGVKMFLGLAADEEKHLRLLLIEYQAIEAGQGWLDPTKALNQALDLDPANPDLPGKDYPEESPIFTPAREPSLQDDIAALEFALETEKMSYDLYAKSAEQTNDEAAKQAYQFLAQEENHHFEILQNSRDYLANNQTWWDDEELPFFEG